MARGELINLEDEEKGETVWKRIKMVKTASAKKAAQQNAQDNIRMDEILQFIKSAGEMGITTNRLREHFKGVMGHGMIDRCLEKLDNLGRISKPCGREWVATEQSLATVT